MMDQKLAEQKALLGKEYMGQLDIFNLIRESLDQDLVPVLTTQDSDGDGLTDENELIAGTNPYLSDTDSDGMSDQLEVLNGTNPLCAEGEVCEDAVNQQGILTKQTSNVLNGIDIPEGFDPTDPEQLMDLELQFFREGDLSQIGVTDPQIQEMLRSTVGGNQEVNSVIQNFSDKDKVAIIEEFGGLSGDELRTFLQAQGFPQNILDQLTDEQIQEVVNQGLENL